VRQHNRFGGAPDAASIKQRKRAAFMRLGMATAVGHRFAFSSTRRPAAVIRTLPTSVVREPATTRLELAFANPAWTSSTMSLIANPCACIAGREQFKRTNAVGPGVSGPHSQVSAGLLLL
jgi:hypothetical protein